MPGLDDRSETVQSQATGGAGEGEPALSVAEIRAELDAEFGNLGEIVEPGDLPTDASIRANGMFDDPAALEDWLVNGGLIGYDAEGNIVKLGLCYLTLEQDPIDLYGWYYQVWIRDSSEALE